MVRWDGGTVEDALWPVRSLRATPPGLAASGRRGKVFQAALGQFEELLRASQAVGPACSPILLYYALSQAGRAILAAHGRRDAWDAHGHGLAVETIRDPIGTTTIKPREGGLFPAVAATTGSPILTSPVTLSGAWGGTPGFARAPGLGDDVPPVFLLSENGGEATVRSVDGGPLQFEEFWHRQDLYPGGSQAVFDPVHFTGRGFEGLVVFRLVSFPDEQAQRLFYDSLVLLEGIGTCARRWVSPATSHRA